MKTRIFAATSLLLVGCTVHFATANDAWVIDRQAEWQGSIDYQSNLEIKGGMAARTGKIATLRSKANVFAEKRSASSINFDQSPLWQNWEPTSNLGPENLGTVQSN